MPTNDIRYYLCNIYAEPHPLGGALLVATNGHMLCAIHDAKATCTEKMLFRVKKDALKFAVQKSGNPAYVTVNSTTARLTIMTMGKSGEELYVQAGKCITDDVLKYPNWKRLIPNFNNLKTGYDDCLSVEYVRIAMNAMPSKYNRNYSASVRFWQESSRKAVYVQYTQFPEIFCIIMPVHENDGDIRKHWEKTFPQPPKVEIAPVAAVVDPA